MEIRIARKEDSQDIQKIYAPYVEKTNITFEYDIPTVSEMEKRITSTLKDYPYLVALIDDKIVGYAYASRYHSRQAYGWDSELSVYLDESYHGKEIGKSLYMCLLNLLVKMNVQNVYACITYPNDKSERFHKKLGFELIGCFHKAGYKFAQWHDVIWMEKHINDYQNVKEIIPFSMLSDEQIACSLNDNVVQGLDNMI